MSAVRDTMRRLSRISILIYAKISLSLSLYAASSALFYSLGFSADNLHLSIHLLMRRGINQDSGLALFFSTSIYARVLCSALLVDGGALIVQDAWQSV